MCRQAARQMPCIVKPRAASYSSSNDLVVEYLRRSLSEYDKPNYIDELAVKHPEVIKFKKSAVLVLISVRLTKNVKGHFVQKSYYTLSKRCEQLKSFKGQVCFVGGMWDERTDQNMAATALREANEEIGIRPEHVTLLGQLSPLITSNNILITPVLAHLHAGFEPVLNKDEVETVFELPTDRFIVDIDHQVKSVKLTGDDEYFVHTFNDSVNNRIMKTWGITALICMLVSTMLHSRAPSFRVDPIFDVRNDNVNEYLEFNLLKNIQRIDAVNKRKLDKKH